MTAINGPITPSSDPDAILMVALGFSAEDLKANQTGIITDAQRTAIERDLDKKYQTFQIKFLIGLGILSVVYLVILRENIFSLTAVLIGFGIAAIWSFPRYRKQLSLETKSGLVEAIEGQVRLYMVSGNPMRCNIAVQNLTFGVSNDACRAFKHGAYYKIYFLPYSGRLMSAEKLSV